MGFIPKCYIYSLLGSIHASQFIQHNHSPTQSITSHRGSIPNTIAARAQDLLLISIREHTFLSLIPQKKPPFFERCVLTYACILFLSQQIFKITGSGQSSPSIVNMQQINVKNSCSLCHFTVAELHFVPDFQTSVDIFTVYFQYF